MNLREKLETLITGGKLGRTDWDDSEYIQLATDGISLIDECGSPINLSILEGSSRDYYIFNNKSKIKSKIKELKAELKKLEKQLSEN